MNKQNVMVEAMKTEIPKEMLEAATKAAIAAGFPGEYDLNAAKKDSARRMAEAALEAARVAALIHENHEARRLLVTRVEAKDLDAAMDRIATH